MEFRIEKQLDTQTEILIKKIIGAAIEVHRELGPGFVEKVYEQAMLLELRYRGLSCATQVPVTIFYKGNKVHIHLLDMIVENKIVVELKSVEMLSQIHDAQVLSYLKSTRLPVGLLINFKETLVKDGIKRFILKT